MNETPPSPPAAPTPAQPPPGIPPSPPPLPPTPLTKLTLSFAGPIQHPASKNLRTVCCNAVNNGAKEIQILFSSAGGVIEEGFSLYNFLRALPVTLTMHCVGSADSIATLVFLAGERRLCCSDATFLFHDFIWGWQTPITVTRVQLGELHQSLENARIRSQGLLKDRAKFSDDDFKKLTLYEKASIYDAPFAKEKGIVHDIGPVVIPPGGMIHNVEF